MGGQTQTNVRSRPGFHARLYLAILIALPILAALWVWASALAFVPVPWPDDSAFYFVARELFKWPPRWVMLPQAPFEPTYRIFNFNTMPLYPILIGIGRWFGIDGSHLLKFWPLSTWALSGSLLGVVLYKKGLPFVGALLVSIVLSMDPILRWASVLVRPESLIGLFGTAIVLGITFGFSKKITDLDFKFLQRWPNRARYWDPVSALLALAAYTHFNAIHLLIPVGLAYIGQPKRLIRIGLLTALYLSPWILIVLFHWQLFVHQMSVQWIRLAVPNGWFESWTRAKRDLFQNMGSPESWWPVLFEVGTVMWFVFGAGIFTEIVLPNFQKFIQRFQTGPASAPTRTPFSLLPAVGWMISSVWLFHMKPEVWFTYYIHLSFWCFAALALLRSFELFKYSNQAKVEGAFYLGSLLIAGGIFTYITTEQTFRMGQSNSWKWSTYESLIDCVEEQLVAYQKTLPPGKTFQVWDPTFPDITIELSRRHPDWEFTRTCDFWDRRNLAIQHGVDVDAVVVPETINLNENYISAKAEMVPEIQSVWMNWREYFLYPLYATPGWKPNRYVCQKGRWQAFLFMK